LACASPGERALVFTVLFRLWLGGRVLSAKVANCTIARMQRKTGKLSGVTQGVKIVPAGLARIFKLEEHGYSYA
jgi:hypothetical protein